MTMPEIQQPGRPVAPPLLDWWAAHGRRDLPWQENPTRYRVWVSEIMLQQTQVVTVEKYYGRFVTAFPDVVELARSDEDSVMHYWSGLGYYARARNLHCAAIRVCDEHGGVVPKDFDDLVALPGIGRSTAGAILALADNRPWPILDGNAKRVLARRFGVEGWPGAGPVQKKLWALAGAETPRDDAARYTQAIMDLGASVCTRGVPRCHECPLRKDCVASADDATGQIPGPRPKRARPARAVVLAMVVSDDGRVMLERRPGEGIWGGLWGFPELDRVEAVADWCWREFGAEPDQATVEDTLRHSFTHFDLTMTPVRIRVDRIRACVAESALDARERLWYNLRRPARIGLAAPTARLLERFGESR